MIREPVLTERHLAAAFWLNAALGGFIGVLLVAAAAPLAAWAEKPEVALVLPVLARLYPLQAATFLFVSLLRRRLDYRALALRALWAISVAGAVGATLAAGGYGAWALVAP